MHQPLRAILHADQERGGEDRRAGNAGGQVDAFLARRGTGGRAYDLQRHKRHHQRKARDNRRHPGPFLAEHHEDRFGGGQRQPYIDGCDHQQDALRGPFKIGAKAAARLVQFGIGGEGDVVQRRDKAPGDDQREEQRFGIEAEIVDREHPPGDEDVALALDDPEQLAQRQRPAEADHPPGALEIEDRAHPEPRCNAHDQRAHCKARDRGIDKRPYAEALPCEYQRGGSRSHRGHQIGNPLAAKLEPPCKQRGGEGGKGDHCKDQRLHAQQVGHCGLAKVIRDQRGEQQLDRGKRPVGDQE